jgi:hypothetical protein
MLRDTIAYKTMDAFTAAMRLDGVEGYEAPDEETFLATCQWLHDTRIAYQLQGRVGRTVNDLVEGGYIAA